MRRGKLSGRTLLRRAGLLAVPIVLALGLLGAFPTIAQSAFPGANGKIAFASNRDGNYEIYTMADDGLNQTRLTNNTDYDDQPTWSPDGTKIAFVSDRIHQSTAIFVMNADGSNQTRLTGGTVADANPSWSPDGTKIAFDSSRDGGNGEIYVMDANGQNQTRITTDGGSPGGNGNPAWSPDGTKIAFVKSVGDQEVYVMNADGSGQTDLSNNHTPGAGSFDGYPSWSPDGTKIAFTSRRDGPDQIYVMNANGSGQVNVSNDLDNDDYGPAWSPDGGRIAFTRGGPTDVWAMTSIGASPVQLTTAPKMDGAPDWQPVPPATITVTKALRPTNDPGRFDLLVDATVVKAAAGNGGSGSTTAAFGSHTVSEVGNGATDLNDYISTFVCTRNGNPDGSGTGTSTSVSVITGDIEVCTFTNKRKATITLRKSLTPAADTGRFNLAVGSTVVAASVGDGGSGSGSFAAGNLKLKEKAALGSLSNYASTYSCTVNGGAGPSGSGTSVTVPVAAGDVVDCTFTNVRKPKLTIKKVLRPTTDPGRFDLLADSTVVRAAAGDGDSGHVLLLSGDHTVSEDAALGSLSDYSSRVTCTKNGNPDVSGPVTSVGITLAAGDIEVCTFRNTRL